jgi:hypothetical protein
VSQRDLQKNKGILARFVGRPCFAALSTNSIRFRFDDREKHGHYIWVDPPWALLRASEEITTSDSYSEDTFEEWRQLFSPLRETTLRDVESAENGEVTLVFSDGYTLFIPLDPESANPDSDYDHWYACDA